MSKRYEEQIWPNKIVCNQCTTQLAASPYPEPELLESKISNILFWCHNCEEWRRGEQIGQKKGKPIVIENCYMCNPGSGTNTLCANHSKKEQKFAEG